MNLDDLPLEDLAAILDHAFERYFSSVGLFGTPDTCMAMVDRLSQLGVDEIACLIDFGIAADDVLAGLTELDELRSRWVHCAEIDTEDYGLAAQIRRHQVTHMQCTPSLLGLLLLDEDTADATGTLRQLLVGGEALSDALVERLRPHFPGMLRNMYGP